MKIRLFPLNKFFAKAWSVTKGIVTAPYVFIQLWIAAGKGEFD
jgi:hypothetical protein